MNNPRKKSGCFIRHNSISCCIISLRCVAGLSSCTKLNNVVVTWCHGRFYSHFIFSRVNVLRLPLHMMHWHCLEKRRHGRRRAWRRTCRWTSLNVNMCYILLDERRALLPTRSGGNYLRWMQMCGIVCYRRSS